MRTNYPKEPSSETFQFPAGEGDHNLGMHPNIPTFNYTTPPAAQGLEAISCFSGVCQLFAQARGPEMPHITVAFSHFLSPLYDTHLTIHCTPDGLVISNLELLQVA